MVSTCNTKRSRKGVSNSRKGSRKGSRKNRNRKGSRKNRNRKGSRKNRMYYGGMAPVGYTNSGPMNLSLAQGQQFAQYHANQHGGSGPYAFGPYPGAVTQASSLPQGLVASAHLLPLHKAFDDIKQFGPQSDLTGGGRRSASGFRGGAGFVPWGGRRSNSTVKGGRRSASGFRGGSTSGFANLLKGGSSSGFANLKGGSSSGFANLKGGSSSGFANLKGGSSSGFANLKGGSASGFKGGSSSGFANLKGGSASGFKGGRRSASGFRGGSRADLSMPMDVAESSKMLIPPQLQQQAGLNPEWKLAENPTAFDPIGK
jgi:hypothetical protein